MTGNALLHLSDIVVAYGGEVVLDHVDLSVSKGEIVTLIGPNGAGKTTLLRIALGLARPDDGAVFRRRGLRVGYMPQHITIDETLPLTVRRFLGLSGRLTRDRLTAIAREVGLLPALEKPVQRLSGGEMQRALLARALANEPALLVLDEPVQQVDVVGRAELYALIGRIRLERGCAVLIVSHDLDMVLAASDSVVCLNRHICCRGAPADIRGHPEFLALFPGDARGVSLYAHHHDHVHAPSGEIVRGDSREG